MKKKVFLFFLLAATVFYAAALPQVIVCGDNPSQLEIIAAEELTSFLQQILKSPVATITEKDFKGGRNAIYLGQTDFASKHIEQKNFSNEEWLLKSVADNLIISGGRPAGTLYGVYAMLEKLGVAFLTPDVTVIPKTIPEQIQFNEQKKPVFAGRLIYDAYANTARRCKASDNWKKKYTRFLLRSRINGVQNRSLPPEYVTQLLNICHSPQWHSLGLFVDRKLFDKHPEYFPMDEFGRRFPPRSLAAGANICVTNPGVFEETMKSLRGMITKNRSEKPKEEWSVVYDISVLDNAPFLCKCPECTRLSEIDGSECGPWLLYINKVAEEITKEYPEIIIRTLIYSAVKNPPKITKPAKNVICWLCDDFTRSDNFRPLTSSFNEHRFEYFNEWKKLEPRTMIWDYWNIGGRYFDPPRIETMIDAIAADLRFFLSIGSESLFYEAEKDQIIPQNFMDLSYFVANRLMVDPEEDLEELIAIFMIGYYGEAGPLMKQWLNKLRESVLSYPQVQNFCTAKPWLHMTGEFMIETLQTLRQAEAMLTKGSPEYYHVRAEMIAPFATIIVNRSSFEEKLKEAGFEIEQMIADLQEYSRQRIEQENYEAENLKYFETAAEARFQTIFNSLPVPEKFSSLSSEQVKFIAYPHFSSVRKLNSHVVDDPDSQYGKALRSGNKDSLYHGVDRLLPGVHNFRATTFVLGNHKMSGRVELRLKEVPGDEKYHWYKMPGTIVLKDKSYFWGHGWAVQAETSPFYKLTDGTEADNTYECWFSAKFTGPSYVEGSTQEDAIWVEAAVLLHPGVWQNPE